MTQRGIRDNRVVIPGGFARNGVYLLKALDGSADRIQRIEMVVK
jgi:hypothetical protein